MEVYISTQILVFSFINGGLAGATWFNKPTPVTRALVWRSGHVQQML